MSSKMLAKHTGKRERRIMEKLAEWYERGRERRKQQTEPEKKKNVAEEEKQSETKKENGEKITFQREERMEK